MAWSSPKPSQLPPKEFATRHPDAGIWLPGTPKPVLWPASLPRKWTPLCRPAQPLPDEPARQLSGLQPREVRFWPILPRLETIWAWAKQQTGSTTWLCGTYSAADAFFAPVAARSPATTCPTTPPRWPMSMPTLRNSFRRGARWVWWTAQIRIFTAATTPAARGPARALARARGPRNAIRKYRLPLFGQTRHRCWNSRAAASVFATPFAVRKPSPIPKLGQSSWNLPIVNHSTLSVNQGKWEQGMVARA